MTTLILLFLLLAPMPHAAITPSAGQYDVWFNGPVPADAVLRATYPGGTWVVINPITGKYELTRPVPCGNASTDPTCDFALVNDTQTWNTTGFWLRRLPK